MKIQREPRYEVEQYLLPKELYTSGPMLLSKIIGDANPVMRDFYARAGEESIRYSFEETHRVYYRDDCSVLVIRIGMPEPEHDHLSRAVYLCYCDRNGENLYFMSELAADGRYLLCCGRTVNVSGICSVRMRRRTIRQNSTWLLTYMGSW